jgi:hypothetical protein
MGISKPKKILIRLQGHTMLLLATTMAFSNNTDLLPQVMSILLDNTKHGKTGCTDEHGAIYHQHVVFCLIGGVAMLLWETFHLWKLPVPNFVLDISNHTFDKFRHCGWYEKSPLCFFASTGSPVGRENW